jgi:hypothetical protein
LTAAGALLLTLAACSSGGDPRTAAPSAPPTAATPSTPSTAAATSTTPPTIIPSAPTTTRPAPPTTHAVTTPARRTVGPIVAIGDSVMLGAAPQLVATFGAGTYVDAKESRTLWPVIDIVNALHDQGRLGERVAIGIGDNGGIDPALIARTMAPLAGVDRVVWINVTSPDVQGWVNRLLASEIPKYPNARLLDWRAAATDRSLFYADGVHLRAKGAQFYAAKLKDAFSRP